MDSYQEAERFIVGSDEHLDIILETQRHIDGLTAASRAVNQELENSFNNINREQAITIVAKLEKGLYAAHHGHYLLKSLHPTIYSAIRTHFDKLYLETKQIEEFVEDLKRYKINEPSDLNDLLRSID